PGVINIVMGAGVEAGAPLTLHRNVRLVSFTGSTETGRVVATNAAQSGKNCSLEMGGKNVMLIMDDADLDLAAEGAVWGAFGTSGQRCTASSRIVVHKKVYKKFVEKLTEKVRGLRVGNGLNKNVEVGPVINQDAMDKILGYIEIGKNEDGATLHLGGNCLDKGEYKHGFFIEPTIFTDVTPQ